MYNLEIEQMDAVVAFLNGDIDGDIYMKLPIGWFDLVGLPPADEKEWVAKLLKALYGLKQSPRLWQNKLRILF
jgi:Reverse transcriptase (RNA-dependent DNA polymerase)